MSEDSGYAQSGCGEWSCKADPRAIEPQDCDWPNCGCDPHADRVISGLIEQGWQTPREASEQAAEIERLRAATQWQPIETAPRDLPLVVRTERGRVFRAHIDWIDADCGWTWRSIEEDDPVPECWTDGVCWTENADGERSDWPVGWIHVPPPPPPREGEP